MLKHTPSTSTLSPEPAPATNLPVLERTLRHFVATSLQPGASKHDVVAAVELDPALLLTVLTFAPATIDAAANWHKHLSLAMFRSFAIALGNTCKTTNNPRAESEWAIAVKRSLLAEELGGRAFDLDPTEFRLVALLGAVSTWSGDGSTADDAGASLLAKAGFQAHICDAVRHQSADAPALSGSFPLVRVNALARRLHPDIETPSILDAASPHQASELVDLSEEDINHAFHGVSNRFLHIIATMDDATNTLELSANAAVAAALQQGMSTDQTRPFAATLAPLCQFLLGSGRVCHFHQEGQTLSAVFAGGSVSIKADDGTSVVAKAARTGQSITVAAGDLALVVERQLLDWLGGRRLTLIPLAQSAGLVAVASDRQPDPPSLVLFAGSAAETYALMHPEEKDAPHNPVEAFRTDARHMAHEVRNPLGIVRNYLAAMSVRLAGHTNVARDIRTLSAELERVNQIVQQFAEGDQRNPGLHTRTANLNETVTDMMSMMAATARGIRFVTHLSERIEPQPLAEDAVRQVLLIVVNNAIEALVDTTPATIHLTTRDAVNVNGNLYLEIAIKDNGPGIPPAELQRLFDPDRPVRPEGRGIGLQVARDLMDKMGGVLSCHTSEDGMEFRIQLPAYNA